MLVKMILLALAALTSFMEIKKFIDKKQEKQQWIANKAQEVSQGADFLSERPESTSDYHRFLTEIKDIRVKENEAIKLVDVNLTETNLDQDLEKRAASYQCEVFKLIKEQYREKNSCADIAGMNFDTDLGQLAWKTNYDQAGDYIFVINGKAGARESQISFHAKVINVNRKPEILPPLETRTSVGSSFLYDFNDKTSKKDFDRDGEKIVYLCHVFGEEGVLKPCSSLSAMNFNEETGVLKWTALKNGNFQFIVTASDKFLKDEVKFAVEVSSKEEEKSELIKNPFKSKNAVEKELPLDLANVDNAKIVPLKELGVSPNALTNVSDFNSEKTFLVSPSNTSVTSSPETESVASSDANPASSTTKKEMTPPQLAAISDINVVENETVLFDINDSSTQLDKTSSGAQISYQCLINAQDCSVILGANFNSATGSFFWIPTAPQVGSYLVTIIASSQTLTSQQSFTMTVSSSLDEAPELAPIANQTVNENVAITTIDAQDIHTGNDTDRDGDTISYTCYYDTIINGAVSSSALCTALTGVTFNTSTGVMNWTPNYFQAGDYEFKITGSENDLNDTKIFSIVVVNVNRAPELAAIADQTVNENVAITAVNAKDLHTNNDTDRDATAITYSCYYDTTIDSTVASVTACTALTGVSFNTSTGVMNWIPSYTQAGVYEFSIIGSDGSLTDDEIFSITVANTNLPPELSAIANITVAENTSITTINAADTHTGNDTDRDGTTITYSCYYDTTIDSTVALVTACTTLTGVSFDTTTGAMDWTPSYTQAGVYEFSIIGSDGSLTDDEFFTITVTNVNRAPELAVIGNETVAENVAITTIDASDVHTGDDTDRDGTAITYSCYYDTTINGAVASAISCATLVEINFNTSTGVMDWTPSYSQSGTYEFKIIGSDGVLTDNKIFAVTVTNVNLPPELATISDQTVGETSAITTINAADTHTSNDTDRDGTSITYSCYYDTTVDATVASVTLCTALTGITFNTTTGVMNWTPSYTQSGSYEFKIIGSDGSLTDDVLFVITVNDVNVPPQLTAISNQTVNENVAITTINAYDSNTNNDTDRDGTAITYSCDYDTTIDAAVTISSACTSLTGLTLNTATGVIDWTPSYSQSGDYEFKITGSDGSLTDSKIFTITVTNVNLAPELAAISNINAEVGGTAVSVDAYDTHTNNDTDRDATALTYTCRYDSTVDAAVAAGASLCSSISGATFDTSTGVLAWTPASPVTYEFKITASDGSLTDSKIFTVTVIAVLRLTSISDQDITRGTTVSFNVNNSDTGTDSSSYGAITYTCYVDRVIDGSVSNTTTCASMFTTNSCAATSSFSLNSSTGAFSWIPGSTDIGDYEIKIVGTAGSVTGSKVFSVKVDSQIGFCGGAGTSGDPYLICDEDSLAAINILEDTTGKYFQLTNSIDLAGATNFRSICRFKGHLNGDNYSITNFTLTDTTSNAKTVGFIRYGEGGSIKKLKLLNASVTATDNDKGVALLIGQGGAQPSGLVLQNLEVTGTVSTGKGTNIGGLIGGTTSAFYEISNVKVVAAITGKSQMGILGSHMRADEGATVTNVSIGGSITVNSMVGYSYNGWFIGGAFGFMQGPGVVFTKIHNDVDLNLVGMSGRYLGGTLGFSCHGMKFYNILHTGKFNTTGGTYTTAGGLVGEFMSSASYSCTATAAQKPIIVNNFILNPDSGSATAYFSTGVVGSNTSGASFSYADVKWNTTNGAPATCGGVCGTANRSSALTNAQMQTAATFDTTYWPVATWQFVDTVAPKLLNGY